MKWIYIALFLYISYSTFMYGSSVFKTGNKFGGILILVLSASVGILPFWILFFVI